MAVHTEGDGVRQIWVYSFTEGDTRLVRTIDFGPAGDVGLMQLGGWDPRGSHLARNGPDSWTRVWSLSACADAEALALKRGDVLITNNHAFHPGGRWLATADYSGLMLWPLGTATRLHSFELTTNRYGT